MRIPLVRYMGLIYRSAFSTLGTLGFGILCFLLACATSNFLLAASSTAEGCGFQETKVQHDLAWAVEFAVHFSTSTGIEYNHLVGPFFQIIPYSFKYIFLT